MEDGDFKNASEYLDRVLDIDPECSSAYAAKSYTATVSKLKASTYSTKVSLSWKKAKSAKKCYNIRSRMKKTIILISFVVIVIASILYRF